MIHELSQPSEDYGLIPRDTSSVVLFPRNHRARKEKKRDERLGYLSTGLLCGLDPVYLSYVGNWRERTALVFALNPGL